MAARERPLTLPETERFLARLSESGQEAKAIADDTVELADGMRFQLLRGAWVCTQLASSPAAPARRKRRGSSKPKHGGGFELEAPKSEK